MSWLPPFAAKRGPLIALALIAGLGGYSFWTRGEAQTAAPAKPPAVCNPVVFGGKRFTECIAVPGKHRIGTQVTGDNGVIYRGFDSLSRDIDTRTVAFAVNGGMYDVSSNPIGYYVEDGKRLARINQRSAGGNFYLKPNGVFFGDAAGNWRIMTTDDFVAQIAKRPAFGTQSGPMLLIGGKLHPQISPTGTSMKIRNAVGVDPAGRAHFVISDEPVSFGAIAQMMLDHAGATDALFLDGTVSALWDPASGRMDGRYPLGPLIVVTTARKDGA